MRILTFFILSSTAIALGSENCKNFSGTYQAVGSTRKLAITQPQGSCDDKVRIVSKGTESTDFTYVLDEKVRELVGGITLNGQVYPARYSASVKGNQLRVVAKAIVDGVPTTVEQVLTKDVFGDLGEEIKRDDVAVAPRNQYLQTAEDLIACVTEAEKVARKDPAVAATMASTCRYIASPSGTRQVHQLTYRINLLEQQKTSAFEEIPNSLLQSSGKIDGINKVLSKLVFHNTSILTAFEATNQVGLIGDELKGKYALVGNLIVIATQLNSLTSITDEFSVLTAIQNIASMGTARMSYEISRSLKAAADGSCDGTMPAACSKFKTMLQDSEILGADAIISNFANYASSAH